MQKQICIYLSEKDSRLKEIITEIGAYSLCPHENKYEFLVNSIISQQLSKHAAHTISQRFGLLFQPDPITPHRFIQKPPAYILSAGVSPQKYKYIFDLSTKIIQDHINLETTVDMTNDEVHNTITKVKGIGDWTANMFLMFCLAREDIFPIEDLAIRKAISHIYQIPISNIQQIQTTADQWKPYRSIGSWYIYRYYDNVIKKEAK